MFRSVITGTGSYIPPFIQSNSDFAKQTFYSENQQPLNTPPEEVVEKFKQAMKENVAELSSYQF